MLSRVRVWVSEPARVSWYVRERSRAYALHRMTRLCAIVAHVLIVSTRSAHFESLHWPGQTV
jgi:hypothetical protein